ncbi:MAG: hypothetical protein QM831_39795 [Kofleriaceae bacterium]
MKRLLIAAALAGCSHGSEPPKFPDAPMQLSDDSDRGQAIDELWVMPAGPERNKARNSVADALFARIAATTDPLVIEDALFEVTSLWMNDPQNVGGALATHAKQVRDLRATFAKSGAVEPTLCALVLLAEIDSAHRSEHVAEIDEILSFSADAAANDTEVQHPPAPVLLQPTVMALPLPWVVERYVTLVEDQQKRIDAAFAKDKTYKMIGVAHEVLQSGRRIASALARAHRLNEVPAHVDKITGLGEDRGLRERVDAVVAAPSASAYYELGTLLRTEEHMAPDHAAALAIAEAGLEKFPGDPQLLVLAAQASASLGRIEQPIAFYEQALARTQTVDPQTALRLGKLYSQRIARLAFGGRPGAARHAWHDVEKYTDQRGHDPVWAQVDAVGETALGRGLLSQGRLDEAEHALVASLDHAPSIDAYETLTTIYWKTDRLGSASKMATAGLALLGDGSGDRYRRAKLERLSGDVMRAAGKTRDASALYLDALRVWTTLGDDKNLPRNIAAERKLEFARGMWYLGNTDRAVDLVLEATETAPDAPGIATESVAFLFEVARPVDALDAMHRGLSSSSLGELDKVYICLWALGDARHRNVDPDRQATDYLKSRTGGLWYELLAEAAVGKIDFATLQAAATTGPHKAELAFYGVTLGLDPAAKDPAVRRKLLESVIDAQLVMDAEYDLAKLYLTGP